MSASYVASPMKETRHNPRTDSLAFPIAARSHRASIRSFELDRVPSCNVTRTWAPRSTMRPTDFCTPKQLRLEYP
jgi:hypothetical protein